MACIRASLAACLPDYKLGNFLHLDYCLPPDEMAILAEALRQMTPEERKIAKRQPKRQKALHQP